jgi:hypothetical protein
VTTSSSSPSPLPVMAAPVVVVVSTSVTASRVAALDYVCKEDASTASSIMVRAPPTAATPVAESGSGAESPPSWATLVVESWGPPPLVAPRPSEPWDDGAMSGFVALEHTSKDQKAWAKSGKKKGKFCNKRVAYHLAS